MDLQAFKTANKKSKKKMLIGMALSFIPITAGYIGNKTYISSHPITPLPERTQAIVAYHEAVQTLPLLESIADETGISMAEVSKVRSYVKQRSGEDDVKSYDAQLTLHTEEMIGEVNRVLYTMLPSSLLTVAGAFGSAIRYTNRKRRIKEEYLGSG